MCWWQAFICTGLSKPQLLNQGTAVGIFTFTSSVCVPPLLPPGTSGFIFAAWNCAWDRVTFPLKCQWHGPQLHKLYRSCSEPKDSRQTCHWEFVFDVQLQIPMTVTEPLGFKLFLVHVNACGTACAHKHTHRSSACSWCQTNWIILEVVN